MNIADIIQNQKTFFNSNQTKSVSFRIEQLKKLKQLLEENKTDIYAAMHADLGKSEFEVDLTELSILYQELNFFIKKAHKLSQWKKVRTNLANFPGKSYIIPEPLGTTLVIGAWNYPLQLALLPALTALAAGSTVILKPSELAPKTAHIIAKIINNHFPSDYFYVYEGGIAETSELLSHRFDKIFFTGSTAVGKLVYQAAAKHLTPVTLELGGKSPTFVLADCDIALTAKRLVWAKFLNAGQTCVAPDYVLADKNIEEAFCQALKSEIQRAYGNENKKTLRDNYLKIINDKHFDRLVDLIDTEKLFFGGESHKEKRFIAPTILRNIQFSDKIMQDEIFGPILPIIGFQHLDESIRQVKNREKPLACYVYSKNQTAIKRVLSEISFGGGAVNDSLMQLSNHHLPFGGVGFSGMGSYHGKAGFDCFTHYKSILHKPFWGETKLKYAPYTKFKHRLLRWLFQW